MANVSNGFFRICWPIDEQKSVIGSILRLNAWYHMKAEKIANQNNQDQLWAFFRKHIFSAKLGQFRDNLRPNLSKNLEKIKAIRYISDVFIAFP